MYYKTKILINPTEEEVKTITNYIYNEWSHTKFSYEECYEMTRHCFCNDVPYTAVIYNKDNDIIAIGQVIVEDLVYRPDIYPWVANVYVRPEYRGNHFVEKILKALEDHAKELHLSRLYLYTRHTGLYEKYGYVFKENTRTFKRFDDVDIQRIYYKEIV